MTTGMRAACPSSNITGCIAPGNAALSVNRRAAIRGSARFIDAK